MSYSMDEEQTLNSLARRIHAWALRKKFYRACGTCNGTTLVTGEQWFYDLPLDCQDDKRVDAAMSFCEKNPGESIVCPVCNGRGTQFDRSVFDQKLLHIVGEVDEAFQLTRKHTPEQLIAYTGRPGVVPIPGYAVKDPCVPEVPDKNLPGHPALAVELADIIIRALDTSAWLGLDIGAALMDKLKFNDTREERHGKLH